MTPNEFRRAGQELIDWIAQYMERVEDLPVQSSVRPGEVRAQLPPAPPRNGEPFEQILNDVDSIVVPAMTHWQSPNFFAYYPANNSGPSILGELLSAGLGVQGMLWSTSPACTELETHMLDWIAGMLDLPEKFHSTAEGGGVIQDSASVATLCALLAARERSTKGKINRDGVPHDLRCYCSSQAHSSVEKAMMIAGLGSRNLRLIATDDQYRMRPDQLSHAIARDRNAGNQPCFVCATVGTTASGAIDPLADIGPICRDNQVWLHVDAAMAGTAALCEEFRWIHAGLEFADSYCFNPHKWMFVNFDCDCFYIADRNELTGALRVLPEYLQNEASRSGQVIDYRDWQVPLGRRFRALKLWFVIRSFGTNWLQAKVREHVQLARELTGWIQDHPDFDLLIAPPLNLVCFRHRVSDEINQRILNQVNATGRMFLTHARLQDQFALRMAIGQTSTQRHHVQNAWQLLCDTAAELT